MAEDNELAPSDTRRFGQESDRKYLYLVIFTLVVVGGGLIAIIFGPQSLLTALPCLLGGAVLILLPWGVLAVMQRWRDGIEKSARLEAEAIDSEMKSEPPLDKSEDL